MNAERLREVLSYDPETGVFTWRVTCGHRAKKGAVAGNKHHSGYMSIGINWRRYLSHRLAWLYVYGVWPTEHLDHINGVRDDNRLANLREATNAVNQQNRRRASRNNKSSGLLGAYKRSHSASFAAAIRVDGQLLHLGNFKTAEEAHAKYVEAKRQLHPGCTL